MVMACSFCDKTQGLKLIRAKEKGTESETLIRAMKAAYQGLPGYQEQEPVTIGSTEILQCQLCLEYLDGDGNRLGFDLEKL
jgi:hypothetical protein